MSAASEAAGAPELTVHRTENARLEGAIREDELPTAAAEATKNAAEPAADAERESAEGRELAQEVERELPETRKLADAEYTFAPNPGTQHAEQESALVGPHPEDTGVVGEETAVLEVRSEETLKLAETEFNMVVVGEHHVWREESLHEEAEPAEMPLLPETQLTKLEEACMAKATPTKFDMVVVGEGQHEWKEKAEPAEMAQLPETEFTKLEEAGVAKATPTEFNMVVVGDGQQEEAESAEMAQLPDTEFSKLEEAGAAHAPAKEESDEAGTALAEGASATPEPPETNAETPAPTALPSGLQQLDLVVAEGAKPGDLLYFKDLTGKQKCAIVPQSLTQAADGRFRFPVHLLHGVVLQSQTVRVPEGATPGSYVSFPGFCKLPKQALVPTGVRPGDSFPVMVPVPQPFPVIVPEGAQPGQEIIFQGPDGRPNRSVVPADVPAGQPFIAMLEPVPVAPVEALQPLDLKPWLDAARNFKMNMDFEVQGTEQLDALDFQGLMKAMKAESGGKLTIQALSDKIFLSRMLDNMGMPQMPLLLELRDPACIPEEVSRFVGNCCSGTHPGLDGEPGSHQEFIVKPCHLSNGEGVCSIQHVTEARKEETTKFLEDHLKKFMDRSAQEFESQALQSLRAGFIVQPKYRSCVDFPMPLELRVVTMWGKARMGVWWWGPPGMPNSAAQRNSWFVRRPATRGELSDQDRWEVVHEHHGVNPGFETGLRHFLRHMPKMAATAEHLATVVGAPFLRVDFFVGSPQWGVRLNEVAYGSGTQHRRPSEAGGMLLVDDAPAMAQILREGMAQCTERLPAEQFLSRLGARGSNYAELSVEKLPAEERLTMPEGTLQVSAEVEDSASALQGVPKNLCATMALLPAAPFAPAANPAAAPAAPQANCSRGKPGQRPGRGVLTDNNLRERPKAHKEGKLSSWVVDAVNKMIGVPQKKSASRQRR
mmetsp:Transcript_17128/g.30662  ORF Transcript_17128/g.30662 Transcript_17128/m.30662 type:complete len:941 (-) Transcript_17128:244-3066(-)